MNDFPYDDLTDEYWANESKKNKLEEAIRAAIRKLEGPDMPFRVREAVTMLREVIDED
jgi:hypothetical protein